VGNLGGVTTSSSPWHGRAQSVRISLPPLSTLYLKHVP
jgi:1,4-alpha-glucan branching enzyme